MANTDLEELKTEAERLHDQAKDFYGINYDNMSQIWEAYCGLFDPGVPATAEDAAKIGAQLQRDETAVEDGLLGLADGLIEIAEELQKDADTQEEASEILEGLLKEKQKLEKLFDGVVLRGADHPFVQMALQYGKDMHDEYGSTVGGDIKLYDENFPGVDGRPDLVTIEDGRLTIYEFKPNNSKAVAMGWEQLEGYVPNIVEYYEGFFVEGRNKGFTSGNIPNSKLGGQEFLDELMNSPDAWTSDGRNLDPVSHVITYAMCDKNVFA